MLLLVLYVAYALVFLGLHAALQGVRYLIRRNRVARERRGSAVEQHFTWEYFLLAGLLLTNALHGAFGYKNTIVQERSWLMSRGPAAQLMLLAAGWALLFLLFRAVASRWPALFGSALGRRSTVALILVAALSCVVVPGPAGRVAAAGTPLASSPASDPTVEPAPRRPLVLLGLDGVDWRLLRAAIRTGRLETFEELVRDGFTASLDNDGLGLSPVVWTAMATGKKMQHHGIFDFEISRSPFFERPIEAWLRYSPSEFAVWRVVKVLHKLGLAGEPAGDGGRPPWPERLANPLAHNYRNLVVNYLVSFPAEKINGVFLAGHIYEAVLLGRDATSPASGATNGFVYPVGLLDRRYDDIKPVAEGPRDVISIEEREFNTLRPSPSRSSRELLPLRDVLYGMAGLLQSRDVGRGLRDDARRALRSAAHAKVPGGLREDRRLPGRHQEIHARRQPHAGLGPRSRPWLPRAPEDHAARQGTGSLHRPRSRREARNEE